MIIIALIVFGLIFGSFVNALVWRLRKQDELAESDEVNNVVTPPAALAIPSPSVVIPAKAGIQSKKSHSDTSSSSDSFSLPSFLSFLRRQESSSESPKTPACAGVTKKNGGATRGKTGVTEGEAVVTKSATVERSSKKTGKISRQGRNDKSPEDYSIMRGRSMCPQCHHALAAKDLAPVFSWLWLRGKCRYCHTPISWQYPVVEVLTAVFFAVSYIFWPLQLGALGIFQLALWLVFVTGFMALAVYDLHWFELPDRIVWPLMALAVLQTLIVFTVTRDGAALPQALLGAAVITGLFGGLYAVSGGKWIGFGDVKLSPVLGLLVGTPGKAFLVIFFASIIGTLASLPMFLKDAKSFKKQIPFGPALLLATFIVVLFGTQIIDWYTGLIAGV